MAFDQFRRQRALRRYRFMFKATLAEIAWSLATIVVGMVVAINTSDATTIGWGMVMLALSAGSAYVIVNATVRLLDHEAHERGWRSLG